MTDFINNANWEFIIAVLAIVTSVYSIYSQRAHNRLTFKPIPVLLKYNYNNRIRILLWNKGNGPLYIKSFKARNKRSLIDIVPIKTRQLTYVDFISAPIGRVIAPSENLNLIEFKIREDENGEQIEGYEEALRKIKKSLDGLVVYIEYSNIYNDKLYYQSEELDFENLVNEEHSVRKIIKTQAERENKKKITTVKKPNFFKRLFTSGE